ncbi:hypothetical protein K466DRAFT_570445 [Polyporus arcularius HHB13444]|uniref:Uncharacterized protein n=1 Tax=Polyporus arcularius HHB13444 TaxID=1314778 RepID=A0A5C3NN71_9APHY|nr:hypothetical protein K466DRAFT_570445 [Polyporus arcularius HHB13444]
MAANDLQTSTLDVRADSLVFVNKHAENELSSLQVACEEPEANFPIPQAQLHDARCQSMVDAHTAAVERKIEIGNLQAIARECDDRLAHKDELLRSRERDLTRTAKELRACKREAKHLKVQLQATERAVGQLEDRILERERDVKQLEDGLNGRNAKLKEFQVLLRAREAYVKRIEDRLSACKACAKDLQECLLAREADVKKLNGLVQARQCKVQEIDTRLRHLTEYEARELETKAILDRARDDLLAHQNLLSELEHNSRAHMECVYRAGRTLRLDSGRQKRLDANANAMTRSLRTCGRTWTRLNVLTVDAASRIVTLFVPSTASATSG